MLKILLYFDNLLDPIVSRICSLKSHEFDAFLSQKSFVWVPLDFCWVTKWRKFTPKNNNAGYSRFVRWKCFKPVLHSSLIFLIISGSSFIFNFRNRRTSKTGIAKSLVPLFCQIFWIKGPSVLSSQKNLKEPPVFIKEPAKNWRFTGGSLTLPVLIPLQVKTGSMIFWTTLVKGWDGFFELNKTVGRGSISSTLMCLPVLSSKKRELPNTGFNLLQCHTDSKSVLYKSTSNYEARRAYVSCRPETCKKAHKFHSSQTRVTLLRCERRSDWSCGNTWGQQQTMLTISVVGEQHLTWHDKPCQSH
jgi:hypothetical protein